MKFLTLHRQAPVAPGATHCLLCDAQIAGTHQDHLLSGQPGAAQFNGAICRRCGGAIARLVEVFGTELTILIQDRSQDVEHLIGGPAARTAVHRTQAGQPTAESGDAIEQTRSNLMQQADRLADSERSLRAEVDKLGSLHTTGKPESKETT